MRTALNAILILALTLSSLPSKAHEEAAALGSVHLAISCSAEAQATFDRAVALLHHMTYPLAQQEFQRVTKQDPSCAMGHWGVAMTLFQPLWPTRPTAADLERGWNEAQAATRLDRPTEQEKLFISSAEAFFREPGDTDYWARIRRWKAVMEELYEKAGDDPEVGAFYALALLATAPPDGSSRTNQDQAAAILLAILAEHPDHPGGIHYLIHANDVNGRESDSLEVVRSYGEIAPRNPHALHMPTHIFTRIGSWEEVIEGNEHAAEAALEYPAGEQGQYVWDEFPHAIEYLVYAHLQRGDDRAAAAAWARLLNTKTLQPSFKTAFHLASIPARYALERSAWREAAALNLRPEHAGLNWDRFPWPEAVTWFARGLGDARLARPEGAERARENLAQLEQATSDSGEVLFAAQIRVLRLAVSAWISNAEGDWQSAERLMRDSADLEAATPKHPVTPGPTLPGFEQLGGLLMEHGKPGAALDAFRRSLELYPLRFNSVLGAARAASAMGDAGAAADFYRELVVISAETSDREGLVEARQFLGKLEGPPGG